MVYLFGVRKRLTIGFEQETAKLSVAGIPDLYMIVGNAMSRNVRRRNFFGLEVQKIRKACLHPQTMPHL